MELNKLVDLIKNGYKKESIIIPEFKFNKETLRNIEFIKMGYTSDWKTIYQSRESLYVGTMDSLLKICGDVQSDKGIGECDVCKKSEDSLDKAVFQVLGKHIQPYIRTYDGHTSSEKIFLPLECEVFGDIQSNLYSKDKNIFRLYPQWDGYKNQDNLKMEYDKNNESKYWWLANKSCRTYAFCNTNGEPCTLLSCVDAGISISFCI